MKQLSLVGPPEEPAAPAPRERLRRRVYGVLSVALGNHDIEDEIVDDATEAVVDELLLGLRDVLR
jgi:hypothetical protein